MNLKIKLFYLLVFINSIGSAQVWVDDMNNSNLSLYEIQDSFEEYWKNRVVEKGKGFKAFKRWENYMEPRVYPSYSKYY
jgi:hypothetical protein